MSHLIKIEIKFPLKKRTTPTFRQEQFIENGVLFFYRLFQALEVGWEEAKLPIGKPDAFVRSFARELYILNTSNRVETS